MKNVKKWFKKAAAALLAVLLLASVVPLTVSAAETDQSTGVSSGTTGKCTWTLDSGVLTISGNGSIPGKRCHARQRYRNLRSRVFQLHKPDVNNHSRRCNGYRRLCFFRLYGLVKYYDTRQRRICRKLRV